MTSIRMADKISKPQFVEIGLILQHIFKAVEKVFDGLLRKRLGKVHDVCPVNLLNIIILKKDLS